MTFIEAAALRSARVRRRRHDIRRAPCHARGEVVPTPVIVLRCPTADEPLIARPRRRDSSVFSRARLIQHVRARTDDAPLCDDFIELSIAHYCLMTVSN